MVPAAEDISTLDYDADLCGNIEQALKGLQGYGVMALELIQNADDAAATELEFDVRKDRLLVRNDAEFSSCGELKGRCGWVQSGDADGIRRPCNFHAISRMGSRSKIGAPGQIGRFGIGFVSVYQITDTPIVRSAETQLTLNPLTGKGAVARIPAIEGTEFDLPWASEASEIRSELHAPPTPDGVSRLVVEEIAQTLRSSLLFLRHLRTVRLLKDGEPFLSVDIHRDEERLTLDFGEAGEDHWIVLSGDATGKIDDRELTRKFEVLEELRRDRIVSVAVPVEAAASIEGRLYAYLPTQHATGMQLHINADFFPHASRQEIVLKGESHERYWNEALIATAAGIIGSNFIRLRDALGATRLWELGSAALSLKSDGAFGEFWKEFSQHAKVGASIWTVKNEWCLPDGSYLAAEGTPGTELQALAWLGIALVDETLRPHWNAMSSVGARKLSLSTIVDSLEERGGEGVSGENSQLKDLWTAIERLLSQPASEAGNAFLISRLKGVVFLTDSEGLAASPRELWRLPPSVRPDALHRLLPDLRIAHSNLSNTQTVLGLLDELQIYNLAEELAVSITSEADALRIIGSKPIDAREFYSLLLSFDESLESGSTGQLLSDTPVMRTSNGFVPPSRAQMPSNFRDPTGYFELVDTDLFPPGMGDFAQTTLGVEVLTFHKYVDTHFSTILEREPTREQYRDIMSQIVARRSELDDQGSLARLRECKFVRTRAGTFVRPADCYFWDAAIERILGGDPVNWVDSNWIPSDVAPLARDLLEFRLGMPVTVTPRNIVDRLEDLAADGTSDEVAEKVTPIVRHVLDRWSRFDEGELEVFSELRDLAFLPAIVDGVRDAEKLYMPGEVYRAARAAGFSSQVPVIDLAPLRRANSTVNALLDLLEVPEVPETEVVVAHLQHCMESGVAPSDVTYAILNERVEAKDDLVSITSLAGSKFIFDKGLETFLGADEVFWLAPPFRNYWWQASSRMSQLSALYNTLGVHSEPEAGDYAALMLRIAQRADLTVEDQEIHSQCVAHLSEALERGEAGIEKALEALQSDFSLLTVSGDAIWPSDAIWVDSPHLAEPFGSSLDSSLVLPPSTGRISSARFYAKLGVPALSSVAQLRLAEQPDVVPAEHDTEMMRQRADLILWVAPNPEARTALRRMLRNIEILHTSSLRIRAEISSFDPPVSSPASSATSYYDAETAKLYVEASGATNWTLAFRSLFSEIAPYAPLVDVKPLVTTATLIMKSDSREEAEQTLEDADFHAPIVSDGLQSGAALEDDVSSEDYPDDMEDADAEATEVSPSSDQPLSPDEADEDGNGIPPHEAISQTCGGGEDGFDQEPAQAKPNCEDGGVPDAYKSKAGTGKIGDSDEEDRLMGEPKSSGSDGGNLGGGKRKKSDGSRERIARKSPMRSYVAGEGDRGADDFETGREEPDIGPLIDLAAVKAALKFEEKRGWNPEEQPHNNPGYDIVSRGPSGERRLIEVKGLEHEWTPRGVKLSSVQFGMAEEHPEEYWLYVVECARDLSRQRVYAVANPFAKVDEYWFDDAWRKLADEDVGAKELNATVGAMVSHKVWGDGQIIEVQKGGLTLKVKVDFGDQGIKFLPFNSSLELVEE